MPGNEYASIIQFEIIAITSIMQENAIIFHWLENAQGFIAPWISNYILFFMNCFCKMRALCMSLKIDWMLQTYNKLISIKRTQKHKVWKPKGTCQCELNLVPFRIILSSKTINTFGLR